MAPVPLPRVRSGHPEARPPENPASEPMLVKPMPLDPQRDTLPPSDHFQQSQLTIDKVQNYATGWQAIAMSLKRTVSAEGAVGALKTLAKINQVGGFDCPGCAWPERADRNRAEFCESGANAIAEETTRAHADAKFFATHSLEVLERADDYWLGRQGRLVEPMLRRPGSTHFEPISYEEGYDLIAASLAELKNATSNRLPKRGSMLFRRSMLWLKATCAL